MKFVAVSTVRDEGAAEVAKEALEAAGLEVEIKRVSPTAYVGPVSLIEFEVRVPEERLADAELTLHQLSEEAEAAATREWQSSVAEIEPAMTSPTDSSSKPLLKVLPTRVNDAMKFVLGLVIIVTAFSLMALYFLSRTFGVSRGHGIVD